MRKDDEGCDLVEKNPFMPTEFSAVGGHADMTCSALWRGITGLCGRLCAVCPRVAGAQPGLAAVRRGRGGDPGWRFDAERRRRPGVGRTPRGVTAPWVRPA